MTTAIVFISHFLECSLRSSSVWQGSSDTLHPLRDYQAVSSHVLWSRLQIWQLIPFNSGPILHRSISVTSLISLLTVRDTPPASAAIPRGSSSDSQWDGTAAIKCFSGKPATLNTAIKLVLRQHRISWDKTSVAEIECGIAPERSLGRDWIKGNCELWTIVWLYSACLSFSKQFRQWPLFHCRANASQCFKWAGRGQKPRTCSTEPKITMRFHRRARSSAVLH